MVPPSPPRIVVAATLLFNRAMRPWHLSVVLTLAVLLAAASAHARPLAISKRFDTGKKVGAGVMLGVPLSAVGKLMITSELAVDLGLGAYVAYRDRTGFHMHADLLFHPFVAVEGETFNAPLYVGLGSRLLHYDGITHVGVRVPLGIAFVFDKAPIDVFLETAFIYDLSISQGEPGEVGDSAPGAVDVNGLVGLRYYFR
jgi:hypothetical protein